MQTFLNMFPIQASTHAAEVDHMTILVHWLMLVLFIGWGFFFLFVLFRFRKGANPKASYTGAHGKFAKSTEVAVAIIEIALLIFYAIPAWATRVKAFPAESEATVVRVVAEQFAWNVHYPGPDGKFGRTDTGRTYDKSVKIPTTGGASVSNPRPAPPAFRDPNTGSKILNDAWKKGSC